MLVGNFCCLGAPGNLPAGPQWSEEQKAAQREAGTNLLIRLRGEMEGGAKDLVIPSGDYRFDNPPRDVEFAGLEDAVIRAEGVVFWFDSRTGKKVRFRQCRNVTIRGLTIDSDPLPWFQGTITAVDKAARTMEFLSDPGYQVPEGARLDGNKRVLFFDGRTSLELPVYDDRVSRMENLGEGKIRIAKFDSERAFLDPVVQRRVEVGDRVAVLLENDTGGGIESVECSEMHLEDITLYGAGGFAYHEGGGGGGNSYLRCKLVRRPGTSRLMASPRDCFHSYLMERGPRIEQCEFSHAADDLIAIHGFFGIVLEKLSSREFLVISPYGNAFRKNAAIEVIDPASGASRGQGTIEGLEEDSTSENLNAAKSLPAVLKTEKKITIRSLNKPQVFKLTLDRELPVEVHDLVSCSAYAGRGAIVRNNFLHDGHVRGILAKTEDLLIENNVIERTGHGGIVLGPEYFWLEGPVNSNIRVVGNRLSHNGWSAFDRVGITASIAAIEVEARLGNRLFPRTFVTGVLNVGVDILDNEIAESAGPGILVMNTKGIRLEGNVIKAPFSAGRISDFYDWSKLSIVPNPPGSQAEADFHEPFYGIFIFDSSDVVLGKNSVLDPPSFLKGDVGIGPRVLMK